MNFIEAKSTKNKQYHHSEMVYKVLKKQCKICRTQRIKLYDAEDLLQCGEIGLLEATQRRPTHVNFEAYCVSYIRGAAMCAIWSCLIYMFPCRIKRHEICYANVCQVIHALA